MGLYDTVRWVHEGLPEVWQTKDLMEAMEEYEIKDNQLCFEGKPVETNGALRMKSNNVYVDLLLLKGKIVAAVEFYPNEREIPIQPKEEK